MKKFAFLDTNVFLHYKVEDIDWCKRVGADQIDIVICSGVMEELDNLKHRLIKNVSERARNIIPKLTSSFEEKKPFKPNVNIIIEIESPSVDWGSMNLDKHNPDDQIIARIIERKNENDVFVTADSLPRIKAITKGLKIIKLEESDRRPYKKTDVEKELERLRQWKDGLPHISIKLLHDGIEETIPTFNIKKSNFISEQEIEETLKKENQGFNSIIHENNNRMGNILAGSLFPVDTTGFEEESKKYITDLKNYLQEKNTYNEEMSRTLPLKIELHSTGKSPAINISCFLKFPKNIDILDEDDFKDPPSEPKKPVLRPSSKVIENFLASIPDSDTLSPARYSLSPEITHRQIIDKEENSIEIWRKEIMHQFIAKSDTIFIRLPSLDIECFEIEYSIHMKNLPDSIKGKIPILIKKIE